MFAKLKAQQFGVELLFCFLCLLIAGGCQAQVSEKANVPLQKKRWGVYQILWYPAQFEMQLNEQIETLGGVPDYVLFFRDLNPKRGFPKNIVQLCQQKGSIPVISYELTPWGQRKHFDGLGRILAGEYDAYFRKWARDAKTVEATVILRFGFEMNGDWFAWGQQPEKFKKAWRHVHQIFTEEEASNVQWLFSPNIVWDEPVEKRLPETYYPGADVVDLVGLDGYNFGNDFDKYHRWESYESVFESSIERMAAFDKPLFIAEIGCAPGAAKAAWLEAFLRKLSTDSRVLGFIYFNYHPKDKNEPNWRLDSDRDSLRVFQQWVKQNAILSE